MTSVDALRLTVLCLLVAVPLAGAAENARIEIFDINHRPAAELVPVIEPLLAEGEAVQASGFQLIVRARPATLTQVADLLERLDRAPRQLLIRVRQPSQSRAATERRSAGIDAEPDGVRGQVRIYSTEERRREGAAQQVRVLEGHVAFVRAGVAVPVGERSIIVGPGGAHVQETTRYRDVTSGFYVLPRVVGDEVILQLAAQRDTLSRHGGGAVETRGAVTTVRARLGEWIEVGGSGEFRDTDRSGILYRSGERSEQQGRIELRVELAD